MKSQFKVKNGLSFLLNGLDFQRFGLMLTSMDKTKLKTLLERAVSALFKNQPNIFDFTPETGQTEWNLAHHYAIEIHKLLRQLDCDLDVIKRNFNDKRPDIIFHSRGTQDNNFLVVEVKRDGRPSEIKEDLKKIKSYWFAGNLNYKFGAVVNLKCDRTGDIEVVENI